MQRDSTEDRELEVFFAAARSTPPPPPDTSLMNRILADAADVTAERAEPARPMAPRAPGTWLRRIFAPLGGLPAAAALGSCAALGLMVGLMGGADAGSAALWDTAHDEPAAAVLAFYDLESPEG